MLVDLIGQLLGLFCTDDRIRTLNWLLLIWEGAAFEKDGNIFEIKIVLKIQSESILDNGVVSINFSRTFFTGIGHVLEYIDQVLKIYSF